MMDTSRKLKLLARKKNQKQDESSIKISSNHPNDNPNIKEDEEPFQTNTTTVKILNKHEYIQDKSILKDHNHLNYTSPRLLPLKNKDHQTHLEKENHLQSYENPTYSWSIIHDDTTSILKENKKKKVITQTPLVVSKTKHHSHLPSSSSLLDTFNSKSIATKSLPVSEQINATTDHFSSTSFTTATNTVTKIRSTTIQEMTPKIDDVRHHSKLFPDNSFKPDLIKHSSVVSDKDLKCEICGKTLSSYSIQRRQQHINHCLDSQLLMIPSTENRKLSNKKGKSSLQSEKTKSTIDDLETSDWNTILSCPICFATSWSSSDSVSLKLKHIRTCSMAMNLNLKQTIQIIRTVKESLSTNCSHELDLLHAEQKVEENGNTTPMQTTENPPVIDEIKYQKQEIIHVDIDSDEEFKSSKISYAVEKKFSTSFKSSSSLSEQNGNSSKSSILWKEKARQKRLDKKDSDLQLALALSVSEAEFRGDYVEEPKGSFFDLLQSSSSSVTKRKKRQNGNKIAATKILVGDELNEYLGQRVGHVIFSDVTFSEIDGAGDSSLCSDQSSRVSDSKSILSNVDHAITSTPLWNLSKSNLLQDKPYKIPLLYEFENITAQQIGIQKEFESKMQIVDAEYNGKFKLLEDEKNEKIMQLRKEMEIKMHEAQELPSADPPHLHQLQNDNQYYKAHKEDLSNITSPVKSLTQNFHQLSVSADSTCTAHHDLFRNDPSDDTQHQGTFIPMRKKKFVHQRKIMSFDNDYELDSVKISEALLNSPKAVTINFNSDSNKNASKKDVFMEKSSDLIKQKDHQHQNDSTLDAAMPDYKSMDLKSLKELAKNYGIRASTKAFLVHELSMIWTVLHCQNQDKEQNQNAIGDQMNNKNTSIRSLSSKSETNYSTTAVSNSNILKRDMGKHGSIGNDGDKDKHDKHKPAKNKNDKNCDDSREKKPSKKSSIQETLTDEFEEALNQFITSRPKLYQRILCYEPIHFDALYSELTMSIPSCSKALLCQYLDKKGVSYISPDDQSWGKRRRNSPRKKQ